MLTKTPIRGELAQKFVDIGPERKALREIRDKKLPIEQAKLRRG